MKKTQILSYLILALASTSLIFLGSCKKDKDKDEETKKVEVRMTDAPASFASLNLEVKAIEIFIEGTGWTNLSSETKTFDVLALTNGKYISLGSSTEFKAGNYTKVKVIFGDKLDLKAYGKTDMGLINFTASVNANASWEGTKSVEIDLYAYAQSDNDIVFTLDFDVAKSVVENAVGYSVKPVIKCLKNDDTGIEGTIKGAASAYVTLDGSGFNSSTKADASGQFKIIGATEGSYSLHIEYYTAGQASTEESKKKTVENITIVNGQILKQGEIQCD
jgi:hypothetical protein